MQIFDHVNVREVEKDDINFIFNSFVNCLSKYHESFFKGWEHKDVLKYLEFLIVWCLNNDKYSVFVACNKDDSTQILSYIIVNSKGNEIFFQYTKYGYRKLGIQKHLLMPLCLNLDEQIVTNWATKEMIKLAKANRITIKHQFVLNMLQGEMK